MINFLILAVSFVFIYINVLYAQKLNLQVLGFVAGLFLILTGMWLFEPVMFKTGEVQTHNSIFDPVTNQTTINVITQDTYSEISTPYFDFFSALQIFCFLGGIYLVLEFIYRQYNL